MRIVGGEWRGRVLVAPPGQGTRPTADRVRQALFDMLMHAPWGGRSVIEDATVLDVFAGTGALGLEALSRGAATAFFIEQDAAALKALRANLASCRAEHRVEIQAADVLRSVPPARRGSACESHGDCRSSQPKSSPTAAVKRQRPTDASLVFLDPPYGQNLVPQALAHLHDQGRIASNAMIIAEIGRDETWHPEEQILAERLHGAARILIFRAA